MDLQLLSQCTALAFFHRFYEKQALEEHDRFVVGTAAVFLAAKVEEDMKKLDDVVRAAVTIHDFARNGCVHKAMRDPQRVFRMGMMDDAPMPREKMTRKVLEEKTLLCERVLLHTLSFDVSVVHPHVSAVEIIREIAKPGKKTNEFRLASWTFLNDSMFTDVCVRFKPRAIAAASVLLAHYLIRSRGPGKTVQASREISDAIERDHLRPTASSLFGFPKEQIEEIVHRILDVYERPRPFDRTEASLAQSLAQSPFADTGSAAKKARISA
ncbi:Cyclin-T1-4 [Hondaea fermentalgiana]|uniref:Cyclin-T1-4 n=1 Tax=Hondaea fermentalgiana TaxID=2315210 RepID=A0A2R5G2J2_9STRA|nr:Cyclin-T1-4 [Hondaea fermentalgiana]|eukprot:GBG24539.1 Cyclin-T1-4 [Hondaea fermentalgiana]